MCNQVNILVSRESGLEPNVPLPTYQSAGAAGADICAYLPNGSVALAPLERIRIPTGLRLEIPDGYEVQIRPRSGLTLTSGLTVLNAPATIDSDYRGQIDVILYNAGLQLVKVSHGDRIAQIIVAPVVRAQFRLCKNLSKTTRGSDGFGSTGID
ncbi:MAG: dUTP diphosphatase [Aestuariivita sp.]|nr:dUTP diphosphatase [Aestuariivita sp.]